jgi:predicted DNA-binding transcriptional regulator YafY
VQRWVMSYGAHARVLAPEALAADVVAELHATLNLYPKTE